MRESTSRTPFSIARAPPDEPEPEPRATHGTRSSWQTRTTSRTSPALAGSTATGGTTW